VFVQRNFWIERWQNGEIGFHCSEVNPNLPRFWTSLNAPAPGQVLVPLCGKSLDMHWLSRQGYAVLGVELSETAVAAFFSEAKLRPERSRQGRFECWQAGNIRILCGDFFDLTAQDVDACNLIYDRAALIALPETMRVRYAAHIRHLFAYGVKAMMVVLEYPQNEMSGPPFCVAHEELVALFRDAEIRMLHEQDVLAQEPKLRNRGITSLLERVYAVVLPAHDDKLCAN
jgi:thiopurine S-methyltransferase